MSVRTATVRTNLVLPRDLVEEADRIAGPRGRSRYVAEALAARLRRDRMREVVDETGGMWAAHPLFPTSEAVVEWVRDGRRETTRGPASGPERRAARRR